MDQIIEDGIILSRRQHKVLQNGGYPMHTFEDVRELYSLYIHEESDRKLIEKAYNFVKIKHDGIFRKSGEPYLQHLIEVAYIVASLQGGPVTIAAAFLHDVVEDTNTSIENIEDLFGKECARIVDSLTKIQRLKLSHRTEADFVAEDHRKIFLGMAKDVRVIIIKLADRLHNMRTVHALREERQYALAKETLEVFAPIAHRLGIYKVENQLEDLSLEITETEKYYEIVDLLDQKIKNRKKSLLLLKKKIADTLISQNIKFEISSRVKSIYSIYKKMYVKGHSFDEIYDVLALRIITETELNCYEILGIIHSNFKPIPGRFKDYIAMPKPNMYQSLHTTVISSDGNIFEVQIRTHEMDEIAESGVAAHWRYKEGNNYNAKAEQQEIEEKLHWFRDLINITNVAKDQSASEYMETLSKDIFEANVYVFTPKGKVIDLPNGSTPLDMAYKIHTKVGETCIGAMVNNTLVPLNTVLKTGDLVEIKTSKTAPGPNESWLNIAKTTSAKAHIRKYLLKKNSELVKEDRTKQGKQILVDFFADREIDEKEMMEQISSQNCLTNFQCDSVDDLFYRVWQKNPTPTQVADFLGIKRKVKQEQKLFKKETFEDDNCPVTVGNQTGFKINLGNCCTPIPGDDIVGYVTKGMGITVHRRDCPNVAGLTSRLIDVQWKQNLAEKSYPVDLKIQCNDRNNLVADVLNIFNENKIKCTEIGAKYAPNSSTVFVSAQIYVKNSSDLNHIIAVLTSTKGIYEVKRIFH